MKKTVFSVPTMDCSAEERIIKMAVQGRPGVHHLGADVSTRQVVILHDGDPQSIASLLAPLNLGATFISSEDATELDEEMSAPDSSAEARTLKIVLVVNAAMFVGEAVGAVLADSSALLADSLDMFADAAVYGIALFGVQRARATQVKAAHSSGVLQLLLALGALVEVIRRVVYGSQPEAPLMIVVALAALAANVTCMWLLASHRKGGAHMRASWIFTTNDVIANTGVILAAILVRALDSNIPDLVVATMIAFVVLSGAVRIMRLKA